MLNGPSGVSLLPSLESVEGASRVVESSYQATRVDQEEKSLTKIVGNDFDETGSGIPSYFRGRFDPPPPGGLHVSLSFQIDRRCVFPPMSPLRGERGEKNFSLRGSRRGRRLHRDDSSSLDGKTFNLSTSISSGRGTIPRTDE